MSRGQGNAFVLRELIADHFKGKKGSCEDFEASFLSGLKVKGKDEAFKGPGHNQKCGSRT